MMGRGLFFGLLWGSVLSALALMTVSLTAPVAERSLNETPVAQSQEPAVPETEVSEDVADADPEVVEPAVETVADAAEEDPQVQETVLAEPQPQDPVATVEAAKGELVKTPLLETAEETAPTPQATADPEIEVAVANPTGQNLNELAVSEPREGTAPQLIETQEAPLVRAPTASTQAPATAETAPTLEPSSGTPPKIELTDEALQAPSESTQTAVALGQGDRAPQATAPSNARVSVDPGVAPQVATATPERPVKAPKPKPIAINLPVIENPVSEATTEVADDRGNDIADDLAPETEIAIQGTPTQGLSNNFTSRGTASSRLPTVGGSAPLATPITQRVAAPGLGALEAFSAEFSDTGLPLLSIVLIDDGTQGIPREQLKNIKVPVSIAIDPSRPDAAEAATEYRAAGLEIVALLQGLANEASPTDVEVTLEGFFNAMTETVAVLDPPDARLQKNRQLLGSVLGVLRRSGHGVITYDQGLNAAQQAAARQGVPAAAIFRILDAEDESAPKIKRYLERAAFNAARDGSVVVLGRNRPETIAAILEWSLERKTSGLAIGPVSAVMLAN